MTPTFKNLTKFGSTWIDLSQIEVIEFNRPASPESDDSYEIKAGSADVQFRGQRAETNWTIPPDDAKLLLQHMETNSTLSSY